MAEAATHEEVQRYWELRGRGMSRSSAAKTVGRSPAWATKIEEKAKERRGRGYGSA